MRRLKDGATEENEAERRDAEIVTLRGRKTDNAKKTRGKECKEGGKLMTMIGARRGAGGII